MLYMLYRLTPQLDPNDVIKVSSASRIIQNQNAITQTLFGIFSWGFPGCASVAIFYKSSTKYTNVIFMSVTLLNLRNYANKCKVTWFKQYFY
jgi:hypothetical protein